jgi:ATP-binding cassette, subfamily B, multidrug efflux pump
LDILWELRGFFRAHWRSYGVAGALLGIIAVLGLLPPAIVGRVVDGIIAGTFDRNDVALHAAAIVVCAILIYICRFLWRRILFGASYRLSVELRQRIYAHLVSLSPAALQKFPAGDVMARATNDVQAVEMSAGEAVLSIFDGVLTGLLVLGVMVFMLSGWLTLLALAPWPLMSWAMWRLNDALHQRYDVAQEAFSRLNSVTQQSIAGIRALRGLGAEHHAIGMLLHESAAANAASFRVAQVESRYDPIIYLTVGASFLLSVGGGAWLIEQQRMTVGQLTSFTLYLGYLVWPMFAFAWTANLVQRGKAGLARIQEFLQTPSAVVDSGDLERVDATRLDAIVREFRYAGRPRAVLRHVEFSLAPGATLAIVGPTGAGKSTLLALLARFYESDGVRIRLGGRLISDYRLDTYRRVIACVLQEATLFSATIRENLLLANPDADDAAIDRVLDIACLKSDIDAFPDRLATEIGERGVTLSGGQRQRLCLARALLGDASILMLDDAMSAVDAQTEQRILAALDRSTAHLSRVIVSNRLHAIQQADEILVLRDGDIVERGKHAALMANSGWYAETWRYQQLSAGSEITA